MSKPEFSARVSSKRSPLPDDRGHFSTALYVREDTEVRATYLADDPSGLVSIHVGGFGGSLSLVVTPGQWRAISAAVDSVLPKAAEVTA